ncbi:MAG: hypothetical protein HUU56_06300 [Bdellovibrionaceae bacterium]|nr:hypothetical protein [Pseudobdellovibrionaceae bacterium]
MKTNSTQVGVFFLVILLPFFPVNAARILTHELKLSQKTIALRVAYQACEPLEFFVNLISCGAEDVVDSDKVILRAELLASDEVETCNISREQMVIFSYDKEECSPDEIYIKATSSKVPYHISIN